jgi:hypothetical protein
MRISELDLSPAAHLCLEVADIYEADRLLEPHNSTEGQPLLTQQLDEYDSCVGCVHTDPLRHPASPGARYSAIIQLAAESPRR